MDFLILSQLHYGQGSTKDQQRSNNNPAIAYSNLVTAEAIRPTSKQSTCITEYNGNFDFNSDDNAEFIDIDLLCNKVSIWLLTNDSITCTKKRRILETEDKANKLSKVKAT